MNKHAVWCTAAAAVAIAGAALAPAAIAMAAASPLGHPEKRDSRPDTRVIEVISKEARKVTKATHVLDLPDSLAPVTAVGAQHLRPLGKPAHSKPVHPLGETGGLGEPGETSLRMTLKKAQEITKAGQHLGLPNPLGLMTDFSKFGDKAPRPSPAEKAEQVRTSERASR
ncbi:hypothetical protein [Streptomyces klenkii]|uniref:hypothetical protein n=1 Tax=Streptomyces klenkii TaxID=1420899 RepID=UPI00343235EE